MSKFFRLILIFLAILIVAFLGFRSWTKKGSQEATTEMTQGDLRIQVKYCQPGVKDRVIFGELVPFDRVWRTGANEATLISFSRDVTVQGKKLAAGEYSLWTIPTEEDWVILFNKQTGQWGTNYDESQDVLKVEVPSEHKNTHTELFTISMHQGDEEQIIMNLDWEKTSVHVEFR